MGEVIHVNFAEEHQKREIASEPFYVFTDERGKQYEIILDTTPELEYTFDVGDDIWEDALTPEDFPLPETEYTLFGWSVRVFDHKLKEWFTLPDFYKTEDSALCHAEMYLMAVDFNPFNDNGDNDV